MIREFLRNGSIYMLGDILVRGISFFLLPFYTRVLTTVDYGMLDMLISFSALINVVISLEITQAVARFFSESKKIEDQNKCASTALSLTVINNLIFLFSTLLFQSYFENIIWSTTVNDFLFIIAMIFVVVTGIQYFFTNQMRWCMLVTEGVVCNITAGLVTILVTFFCIYSLKLGLLGVLYGMISGGIVSICIGIKYVGRYCFHKPSFYVLVRMLKFSLPLVFSSIIIVLSNYVDRWMIKSFLSLSEVGIYGVAFKIASIASLLTGGFNKAIMPLVYSHHTSSNVPNELSRIFSYFIITCFSVCIILSGMMKELLAFIAPSEYSKAAIPGQILFLSVVFNSSYMFFPGIFIKNETRFVFFISIVVFFINLCCNVVLIPILGINGAAVATLISSGMCLFLYYYFGQKFYKVSFSVGNFILSLILLLCIAIFNVTVVCDMHILLRLSIVVLGLLGLVKINIAVCK